MDPDEEIGVRRTKLLALASVAASVLASWVALPLLNYWGLLGTSGWQSGPGTPYGVTDFFIVQVIALVGVLPLTLLFSKWPGLSTVWIVWYLLFPWGPTFLLLYITQNHAGMLGRELTACLWLIVPAAQLAACMGVSRKIQEPDGEPQDDVGTTR